MAISDVITTVDNCQANMLLISLFLTNMCMEQPKVGAELENRWLVIHIFLPRYYVELSHFFLQSDDFHNLERVRKAENIG